MNAQTKLAELLALPAEERLALIEALWTSLVDEVERIPLPDWQRQLLDERIAEEARNGDEGETWDDLRKRLDSADL
jgi:putative addiction module component (TIGR02574 family)